MSRDELKTLFQLNWMIPKMDPQNPETLQAAAVYDHLREKMIDELAAQRAEREGNSRPDGEAGSPDPKLLQEAINVLASACVSACTLEQGVKELTDEQRADLAKARQAALGQIADALREVIAGKSKPDEKSSE